MLADKSLERNVCSNMLMLMSPQKDDIMELTSPGICDSILIQVCQLYRARMSATTLFTVLIGNIALALLYRVLEHSQLYIVKFRSISNYARLIFGFLVGSRKIVLWFHSSLIESVEGACWISKDEVR